MDKNVEVVATYSGSNKKLKFNQQHVVIFATSFNAMDQVVEMDMGAIGDASVLELLDVAQESIRYLYRLIAQRPGFTEKEARDLLLPALMSGISKIGGIHVPIE